MLDFQIIGKKIARHEISDKNFLCDIESHIPIAFQIAALLASNSLGIDAKR
ncbi:hypothetical protein [Xenorhabdus szentirmaii]|uniref:Uncharacterized protein n=1 Tax=Xenorhabdus szentirmaii TaxID=290112 RepID=A0AAW3Z259_9GAMM|nr:MULTISPECIES: hypothetical protein [Xenorhabdus]MBD2781777.1 hypothetical protein [Xenorhabdus sp. 38]MBD2792974.1 hypothetical protein [Xenorhabdus sp. CUL]MBD2802548.1 hypothetical protein [Xenorhabdus sp. M]MBD2806737.1 hypothetical protein [Xenorhabdus sp. ZM]MBD2822401.1 hypothetical protein [Xenorhabdus sp. 42]